MVPITSGFKNIVLSKIGAVFGLAGLD